MDHNPGNEKAEYFARTEGRYTLFVLALCVFLIGYSLFTLMNPTPEKMLRNMKEAFLKSCKEQKAPDALCACKEGLPWDLIKDDIVRARNNPEYEDELSTRILFELTASCITAPGIYKQACMESMNEKIPDAGEREKLCGCGAEEIANLKTKYLPKWPTTKADIKSALKNIEGEAYSKCIQL